MAEAESALARRFTLARRRVELGSRSIELLTPENADDLISEADYVMDDRLPYWADVWPSSIVLARHISGLDGAGRTLLELGCGVGLVAVAAVAAGFDTTATDYYPDALTFAAINVRRATGASLHTRILDWRSIPRNAHRFDVVVAADVLYEARYPPLVAEVMARTLAPGGSGLVADPGRVAAPAFSRELAARRLAVTAHERVPYRDGEIKQTIDILTIEWGTADRA